MPTEEGAAVAGAAAVAAAGAGDSVATMSTIELREALKVAEERMALAETRTNVLESELARFKDQHAFVAAAKEAVAAQLREEVVRREAAEEKVELLRGQVEQARRSVMQLQKQDQDRASAARQEQERAARRVSIGRERRESLNLGRDVEDDSQTVTSSARKRQSMYRKRLSSQGPGGASDEPSPPPEQPVAPPKSGLRELRLGGHARTTSMSLKAMDKRDRDSKDALPAMPKSPGPKSPLLAPPRSPNSPTHPGATPAAALVKGPASVPSSEDAASTSDVAELHRALSAGHAEEVEALRSATAALREQVDSLASQLADSEEARLASEAVLRSLREFMAGSNDDVKLSLPPLPTDPDADEEEELVAPPDTAHHESKGWGGFRLWGSGDASAKPEASKHESDAAPLMSPPTSIKSFKSPSAPSPGITISPPLASSPPATSPPLATSPPQESAAPLGLGFLWGGKSQEPKEKEKEKEQALAPEVDPEQQPGAGLGRKMTSFFGRAARRQQSKAAEAHAAASETEIAAALAAAEARAHDEEMATRKKTLDVDFDADELTAPTLTVPPAASPAAISPAPIAFAAGTIARPQRPPRAVPPPALQLDTGAGTGVSTLPEAVQDISSPVKPNDASVPRIDIGSDEPSAAPVPAQLHDSPVSVSSPVRLHDPPVPSPVRLHDSPSPVHSPVRLYDAPVPSPVRTQTLPSPTPASPRVPPRRASGSAPSPIARTSTSSPLLSPSVALATSPRSPLSSSPMSPSHMSRTRSPFDDAYDGEATEDLADEGTTTGSRTPELATPISPRSRSGSSARSRRSHSAHSARSRSSRSASLSGASVAESVRESVAARVASMRASLDEARAQEASVKAENGANGTAADAPPKPAKAPQRRAASGSKRGKKAGVKGRGGFV